MLATALVEYLVNLIAGPDYVLPGWLDVIRRNPAWSPGVLLVLVIVLTVVS
jgi:hypothetical protein